MNGINASTLHNKTYQDIIKLYDYAEMLVDSANKKANPQKDLEIIQPLIKQIEETAEVLAEAYITSVETGTKPTGEMKERAENSIKKIYVALNHVKKRLN